MSAKKRAPRQQETARLGAASKSSVKSPMGRPARLLDAEMQKRVLAAVRLGQSRTQAAEYAGIGRSTLMNAIHRGRVGDPLWIDFVDRLKRAESYFERRALKRIQLASMGTWQAAAWLLERKHPKRWGVRREVTHNVGDRIAGMTPAQHVAELARLREEIAAEEKRLAEDANVGGTLQ